MLGAPLLGPPQAPAAVERGELVAASDTQIRLEVGDEVLASKLAVRLADHGVHVTTNASSHVADVRVAIDDTTLQIVMVDAKHPRAFVRTVPYDGSASAVAVEEASLIVAQSVLAIRDGRPVPNAEPQPIPPREDDPPEGETEPSVRAKTNFPHGGYLGGMFGLAALYEWAGPHLGYTLGLEGGYVFGKFRRHTGLRIGLGVAVEAMTGHPYEGSVGAVQALAKLRVGFARGPAWMYAMAGGGHAAFWHYGSQPLFRHTLAGQVGVGTAFRVSRRLSIGVEGTASGTLFGTSIFGGQVLLTGYFGKSSRKR